MGKFSSWLFGLGLGAGLMYLFDPQLGRRRQALLRDRFVRLQNQGDEALSTATSDLRNRARGVLSNAMAVVSDEEIPDYVLEERIRSRLGFMARHPGAVQVSVNEGRVTLTGDMLAEEASGLLRGVSRVRGVRGVENTLNLHQEAGDIQQLQGEGWMAGSDRMQWSPSTRLLAGLGSTYLMVYGMGRGGFIGFLARIGGLALGTRAVTNQGVRRIASRTGESLLAATGGEGDLGAIDVTKTITINAPREEVYGLWSNYENFAQFMNNIEAVHDLGGGRSHWIVKGPVGSKVEFDAITTEKIPNEVVAWETTPDSTVRHSGRVRFKETRPGRTQVNVNMTYTPPAGVAGHAVAVLFGKDPKSEMDEDLRRMKNLLERGATLSEGKTVTRDQVMPVTGGTAQNMDALGTVDAANEDMGAREEDMNVSPMDEIGVSVRGEDADPVEDDSMSVPYQGSIKGELDRGEDTNHEDDLGHSPMQGFEENNTGE